MLSGLILPMLLLALLLGAAWRRLPMYDLFVTGAKEGMRVAASVLPNLAAMLCAISLMQASGLMDALCEVCAPLFAWLGLPKEVAPLVLLRPLSGSASLAMVERLMRQYGADSRIGLIACTVMGSSETIFYTICVYMSVARDRRTGYAAPCALIGSLVGVWLAGRLF
ncbi:MAG: spore maturation protein [Clostridiales bacterium]|nr:spore maturation protein [Clostridiales bacterium]MDO4349594.1 nucleoside recognition domain-containing protein [Eubacteriales bacterium]MDY4007305.1 nucleoside recognition domain-containing protein [Candidatus Limiplasma sp.]